MAPEILSNVNIEARPSIDVWSMGCILYSLVCGELPFNGKSSLEIIDKIKKGEYQFPTNCSIGYQCRKLIRSMLNVDYQKRISIKEVINHPWMQEGLHLKKAAENPTRKGANSPLKSGKKSKLKTHPKLEKEKEYANLSGEEFSPSIGKQSPKDHKPASKLNFHFPNIEKYKREPGVLRPKQKNQIGISNEGRKTFWKQANLDKQALLKNSNWDTVYNKSLPSSIHALHKPKEDDQAVIIYKKAKKNYIHQAVLQVGKKLSSGNLPSPLKQIPKQRVTYLNSESKKSEVRSHVYQTES